MDSIKNHVSLTDSEFVDMPFFECCFITLFTLPCAKSDGVPNSETTEAWLRRFVSPRVIEDNVEAKTRDGVFSRSLRLKALKLITEGAGDGSQSIVS